MPAPLNDLPPYVYGTTRLGHADVPVERRHAMALTAIDAGLWLHTSRQYDDALEVLGGAFAQRREAIPPLVVKLGGGTADYVRATLAANLGPLGVDGVTIGQLSPVEGLGEQLATGGPELDRLRALRDEGLVGRFVLEIFPWTSAEPLAALRAGHLAGLVDGFIFYLNPLQRFASNELWGELQARGETLVAMRTVCGAPVHDLRDVPGAAWRPYLQERAVEVAPVYERSGAATWTEFCVRFAHSVPGVVSTVGSTSRPEHLTELVEAARSPEPLPGDVLVELFELQSRWADEVDAKADPWTM